MRLRSCFYILWPTPSVSRSFFRPSDSDRASNPLLSSSRLRPGIATVFPDSTVCLSVCALEFWRITTYKSATNVISPPCRTETESLLLANYQTVIIQHTGSIGEGICLESLGHLRTMILGLAPIITVCYPSKPRYDLR